MIKATVIECMLCGHRHFKVKAKYEQKLIAQCESCGSSVEIRRGALCTVGGFKPGELQQRTTGFVQPEVQVEKPEKEKKENPFVSLSMRMLPEQREVVRHALKVMREIQGIKGRSWHGTAIELICADFLSGVGFRRAVMEVHENDEPAEG